MEVISTGSIRVNLSYCMMRLVNFILHAALIGILLLLFRSYISYSRLTGLQWFMQPNLDYFQPNINVLCENINCTKGEVTALYVTFANSLSLSPPIVSSIVYITPSDGSTWRV
jgi:hypothetical protein